MTKKELKACKLVEEFVKNEVTDYSYFDGWEVSEAEESGTNVYVTVDFFPQHQKSVHFKVSNLELIEVELGESSYHTVDNYCSQVKYFWMALLNWN